MGFLKEFKTFINQGNVVDLAVGVVIGAAFGKIVSSFVDDIISPIIGLLVTADKLTRRTSTCDLSGPIASQ